MQYEVFGEKSALGNAMFYASAFGSDPNKSVSNDLRDLKFDVHVNAPFDLGKESRAYGKEDQNAHKLVPMIFIHGFGSQGWNHSGQCRELASHGYIVFNIDMHDGSCTGTETADGKFMYFGKSIATLRNYDD